MKLKGLISSTMIATMLFTSAYAPAGTEAIQNVPDGKVYFLNEKPEDDAAWQKIADTYTAKTGVEVTVVSTARGAYDSTLEAEMTTDNMPTLFTIDGALEYKKWKNYCLDLSHTNIANWVTDKGLLITEQSGVYGLPQSVDSYGLIANKYIFNKYFNLKTRANTGCNSIDDINSFEKLKAVTEDMQKHKNDIGILGVFSSSGMDSDDWKFNNHLLNIPLVAEFKDSGVADLNEIEFKYANNYKQIWDLYITNSVCLPVHLSTRTAYDAVCEFATGQSAILQDGAWAWTQIKDLYGNIILEEDIAYLPIYMGLDNEENQGLCADVTCYFSINSQVSQADQEATIAFLEWLYGSEEGKTLIKENYLYFVAPYSTFTMNDYHSNPLIQATAKYLTNPKYKSVVFDFTTFPSQEFQSMFSSNLLSYSEGTTDWNSLVVATIESWKNEKALNEISATDVLVRYVSLDKTAITLDYGNSFTLTPTVVPTNSSVTWTSSNPEVATVNNGYVLATGTGTTTIKASIDNGVSSICTVTVLTPKPSVPAPKPSITLNKKNHTLKLGTEYKFVPTVVPANSTITWKSSNSNVVTVNNGLIKATGVGTATITASTTNGVSATCTITVPSITSVKKVTLLPNKTYNLKSKLKCTCKLTYKSSNTKIAKIYNNGKIKAIKAGKATITVKFRKIKVAKIDVVVPGITLKKSSATIKRNKTTKIQIKSKVVKNDKVVSYKVDKKKIASVNKKGVVKGLRKGTATITVKMKSGTTAKFKVKVK